MSDGGHDWKIPKAGQTLLITAAMPWDFLEQKDGGDLTPCLPGFEALIIRVQDDGRIVVKRLKDCTVGAPTPGQSP